MHIHTQTYVHTYTCTHTQPVQPRGHPAHLPILALLGLGPGGGGDSEQVLPGVSGLDAVVFTKHRHTAHNRHSHSSAQEVCTHTHRHRHTLPVVSFSLCVHCPCAVAWDHRTALSWVKPKGLEHKRCWHEILDLNLIQNVTLLCQ